MNEECDMKTDAFPVRWTVVSCWKSKHCRSIPGRTDTAVIITMVIVGTSP